MVGAGRVHLCRVAGNTCDPIWHVTPHSSRTSSRRGLYSALTFTFLTLEQVFRSERLRVHSPSEVSAARRTLPRPAAACTTRQPAVVCHTVHSREIDRPVPQLAVAPPPTSSVPRSAPLRRRHVAADLLSSSSKATQTTAAAAAETRYWTFDELLASRGIVDDHYNDNDEEVVSVRRPCSAPRVAFDGACQRLPTSTSSEAALVDELARRGRHASLERFADTTDMFELLTRFQSATTFPDLSRANDLDVHDDQVAGRQPHLLYGDDAAVMPGANNFRSDHDGGGDEFDVFADGTEYAGLPSDGVVRWTDSDSSAPDQVCRNPDDREEGPEDGDNTFSDESPNNDDGDGASVSSMASTVEYPPSDDVIGGGRLACSSGRHLTSTPMTGIPARHRDEDFPQHSEIARQLSSTSPCDDDEEEEDGSEQVRHLLTY